MGNSENLKNAKTVLREWAIALRGDWGSIDGRTCRAQLDWLVDVMDDEDPIDIRNLRDEAGVCLDGNSHWREYCDDDC